MASVAYPQANGQAEASNKTILHDLKTRLEKAKGGWADELPSILWAYRTTSRVPTRETPFSLAYGTDALIPVEVDLGSPRVMAFKEECNLDCLRENLDLLDELREKAAIQLAAYRIRFSNYYNERVRPRKLEEGDLVLRKAAITNALREEGKLRPNWEGSYKIRKMLGPNTCILQTLQGEAMGKTWNTMNLKRYFPTLSAMNSSEEGKARDAGPSLSPEALPNPSEGQDSL
ncbi:uncharacterized protein LOC127796808 [Diospyros lotus]|uniref:uncharacterized protein LOC127796808 n=1 Tax=Diospyros lotus TaxID=55363 RepID=UPI0022512F14|nr:uncharacterized protein LOC127796808 [Diospyros lotus]